MRKFNIIINISFCLFATMSFAQEIQEEPPRGEIRDAQIIIEKDKPLTLPIASRLFSKTEVLSISEEEVAIKYELSDPKREFEVYTFDLPRKEYVSSQLNEGYANFVKLGFGNYVSPLVQAYLSKAFSAGSIGLWLNHESFAKGPVRDDESAYSRSQISLAGHVNKEKIIFKPRLSYERQSFYYYGFDKPIAELLSSITPFVYDRVGANRISFSTEILSGSKSDLDYYLMPKFGFQDMALTGENSFNKEFDFDLSGGVFLNLGSEIKGSLGFKYQFLNYTGGVSQNRNILSFRPQVHFKKEKLNARVGADISVASDSANADVGFYIFPNIQADFQINDKLSILGDISGGVNAQSLRNTLSQVLYLEDSLTFSNQNEKINTLVGLQFSFTKSLLIQPYLKYSLTENKGLIYVSSNDSSRYEWSFDKGNFGQLDLGVKLVYATKNSLVSADMKFTGYTPDQIAEAWYLPANQLTIHYNQMITKSMNLSSMMIIMDGIKAMRPITYESIQLNTIIDFGMTLNYQINDHFSAFIEGQNLFNQSYERYLNYPVRSLTAKIGFNYRF